MKMLQVSDAEDNDDDKNGEIVIREAYLSMLWEGLKRLRTLYTCKNMLERNYFYAIVNKTKLC